MDTYVFKVGLPATSSLLYEYSWIYPCAGHLTMAGDIRKLGLILRSIFNPSQLCLLLIIVLSGAVPARSADCDGGWRLNFNLTIDGGSKEITDLLRSVSSLQAKNGNCFRSLSRLDSQIEQDREVFDRALRSEGYYGALIDETSSRTGNALSITMRVFVGQPFLFKEPTVEWRGDIDSQLVDKTLENLTSILAAQANARSTMIVAAEDFLTSEIAQVGYPFADSVSREVIVDHATKQVAVTYVIDPGPLTRYGDLEAEGTDHVQTAFLERLRPYEKGALVKRTDLGTYQKRLQDTGLFRSVQVSLDQTVDEAGVSSVLIKAEEAPARRFDVGAGFSTGQGLETEFGWRHRNFLGRGQTLSAQLNLGEGAQTVQGGWRSPHFKRYDQSLLITGRIGHEDFDAYSALLAEGYVGIERPLTKRLKASLGIRGEMTEITLDTGQEDTFLLAGLPFGLVYDSSDQLFDPTKGGRFALRLEPLVSMIDDRDRFLINEIKVSHYWSFGGERPHVLAVRGRLGSIWGPDRDRLPSSERFYAGGGGSVRGFGYQQLGPLSATGAPIGGRSVVETAVEFRARVSESISLVGFIDGGSVSGNKIPTLNGYRFGAGVGFRYHTAIAPIRFDIATPLGRRDGESSIAIYLGIGQSF